MSCEKCAYKRSTSCRVMTKQFDECWNNTSKEVARQREVEIKAYSGTSKK